MEEKKIVTAQDVADRAGCSVGSVWNYFSAPLVVSKTLSERIRKAAEELGYDPKKVMQNSGKNLSSSRWAGKVTMRDIAQKCGVGTATVGRVFLGRNNVSKETREAVLKAAEELGYVYQPNCMNPESRELRDKARAKAEKERKFSIRYAGFKNATEQNQYMQTMRTMGYSNVQISKKVGLTPLTVRRRIGPQPEDMSEGNRVEGQKKRARENQRRRIYVDTHLVRTYNSMIMECGKIREQAAELVSKADKLTKEIIKMQPQVAKATLSTEKPAELPAEQLKMNIPVTASENLQ